MNPAPGGEAFARVRGRTFEERDAARGKKRNRRTCAVERGDRQRLDRDALPCGGVGRGGRSTRTRDFATIVSSRNGLAIMRLVTRLPKGSIRSLGGSEAGSVTRLKLSTVWPPPDGGVSRSTPAVSSTMAP